MAPEENDLYDYSTNKGTRAGAQVASAGLLPPEKWVGASGTIVGEPGGRSLGKEGLITETAAQLKTPVDEVRTPIPYEESYLGKITGYGVRKREELGFPKTSTSVPVTASVASRGGMGEPTPEDRRLGYERELPPVTPTTTAGITPKTEWEKTQEELAKTGTWSLGAAGNDELARQNVLRKAGGEPYVKPEILAEGGPRQVGFGAGPGGQIATIKGGMRTLDEKETEEWGPGGKPERPGEFDYTKFKQGLSQLGIPLGSKEISNLFGIALKHHEGQQQAYDKMVETRMQYGEKSPAGIGARTTAKHYDVVNAIALAKEPRDIATALLNDMKTKAEIGGMQQHGALNEAQAKVLLAGIDNPRLKPYMTLFQADMKALGDQAIRLTPEAYEIQKQKLMGGMMGRIQAFDFADKIREAYPTAIVPDQLGPGMSFDIGPKKYTVQADGSIKESMKKGI